MYAVILLAVDCQTLQTRIDIEKSVHRQGVVCAWLHIVHTLIASHVPCTELYATVLHAVTHASTKSNLDRQSIKFKV